jgi:hypothetical protein
VEADRIALRASSGFYLANGSGSDEFVIAGAAPLDDALIFQRHELGNRRIILAWDGHAMAYESGSSVHWLRASARGRQATVFIMQDLFA